LISANKSGFGSTSLIPDVVRNRSLLQERLKGCFAEREDELEAEEMMLVQKDFNKDRKPIETQRQQEFAF
jgi:hypothetical protein